MDTSGHVCTCGAAVDATALAVSVMSNPFLDDLPWCDFGDDLREDFDIDIEAVFARAERHREEWRKKISIDYTRQSVPAGAIMNGITAMLARRHPEK